jgi:hypothetical protein
MMKRVLKVEFGLMNLSTQGATCGGDIMGAYGSNARHFMHIRQEVAA